jgi:hypothetical protein
MVQPYMVVKGCDEKVHVDSSCVKYLAYGVGFGSKAFWRHTIAALVN